MPGIRWTAAKSPGSRRGEADHSHTGPPFTPTRRRTLASTGGHPVTQRGRPPTRWTRGHTDRGTDTPPALRAPAALLTTARAAPPFTRQVPDSAAPASGRPSPTRLSADYVDRSARRLARRRRGDTRLTPAGAATHQSTLAATPGARPGTAAGPEPAACRRRAEPAGSGDLRPRRCGRGWAGATARAQPRPIASPRSGRRPFTPANPGHATYGGWPPGARGWNVCSRRATSVVGARVRGPAAPRSDRRGPTTTGAATETRAPSAASMRNGRQASPVAGDRRAVPDRPARGGPRTPPDNRRDRHPHRDSVGAVHWVGHAARGAP